VPDVDPSLPGRGVLGHVGHQLADREVDGRFDRWRQAAVQVAGQLDPHRAIQRHGPDRVGQAAVGQHRRVDAADQVAQLGQGLDRGVPGLDEQRPRRDRIGVDDLPGGIQGHAHRHQPGLRPVVQVTLDPADLGRSGVEGLGPGPRQLADPQRQLGRPGRRQHRAGHQRVTAEQPGCRRHSDTDDPQAEQDQRARRVAGKGGRRDRPHQLGPDELDEAGQDDRRGQRGQQPADQVHQDPPQVPPGGLVGQQPAKPPGQRQRMITAGRRRPVRISDRHAAPLAGQPPGLAGQAPHRGQRARSREPAETKPRPDHQQAEQRPLSAAGPAVGRQQGESKRGQAGRRDQDHKQAEFGQHQPGEGQPPGGGDQASEQAQPRPAALDRNRGDHRVASLAPG
jgi:hypothetical protein